MVDGIAVSNGQELYFEIAGDGPPLVLIMGIGYDSTLWMKQVPELSEHFQVITFDNRDVGRSSEADAPYAIEDMADDVAGLLDQLGIERAHILGLSMGGQIAQRFALRHPDRVERLILSGTGAAPARRVFDPIELWSWVKGRDESGMLFARQQFLWLFSDEFLQSPEAVDQTLKMLADNPNPISAEAYARQAQAYTAHDCLDELGAIDAPTLVICGERDRLTPPWICRALADAIPRARFELVRGPGASHALPLERPDEFNRRVTAFLQEPSPARQVAQGGQLAWT